MTRLAKFATTGAVTLALAATSLTAATPASANDRGAGAAIAIGAGLIIGSILLNEHRNRDRHVRRGPRIYFGGGDLDYNDAGYQPACYLGPVKYRWVEDCRQGRYGDLFCHKTKQPYQEQFCN